MDVARAGAPSGLPPVSLIIASRDRPRLLLETVQSVLAGAAVPAEIVVVDQSRVPNATLAALRPARPCAIRYLLSRTPGLSRARNRGVAAARSPIVAFLDDDMLVEHTWFGALIRALLAAGERAAVTGRVLAGPPEVPGGFQIEVMPSTEPAVYAGRAGRDMLAGGHMAIRRAAFAGVGGFDVRLGPGARFPSAEDNDFGFRLLEAGYRIVYVPEALVYHRAWRTTQSLWRLRWGYGLGQGAFYAKHLRRADPYMLGRMGQDLCYFLRRPRRLVYEWRWAYSYAGYLLGMLTGALRWWLSRPKTR